MARNTYGNTTWDEAVDASNPAQLALSAPGGTYPLFNAAGVAQTDFLLWNTSTSAFDITATSITVGSDRYLPLFQGPDATELYDAAGHRLPHFDNLTAAPSGFYTKPGGGIPESDLDTTTQGKIDGAVPKSLVTAKGDLLVGSASGVLVRKAVGTDGQVLLADSTAAGGLSFGNRQTYPTRYSADVPVIGASGYDEATANRTIRTLHMHASSAPVGSALSVEVHHWDGTTWTTLQTLTIADGATTPSVTVAGLSQAQVAGNRVRIYALSVGSTTAARGVVVDVIYG